MKIINRRNFIKASSLFFIPSIFINSMALKENKNGIDDFLHSKKKLINECHIVRKEWEKKFDYTPESYLQGIQMMNTSRCGGFVVGGLVISKKEAALVSILSKHSV